MKTPNDQHDEYDKCAHCGRKFLARTSADNFYCDDCYKTQEYLEDDNQDNNQDDDPRWYYANLRPF